MTSEDILVNFSDFVSDLPLEIIESIDGFILVLKAVGIAAIAYVIYAIVMGVFSFHRTKRLRHIERKVDSIDKKLSKLLKKRK